MGGLDFWLVCGTLEEMFFMDFRLVTQVKPAQAAIDFVVFYFSEMVS
jgi:hypothetical protein